MTKIYAHRGASAIAPENTMPAFEKALLLGSDGIEIDVHLTSDGIPVVAHDETVNRVSDGSGRIIDHTLDELRAMNFGVKFAEYGKVKIPTLEEVLTFIGSSQLGLNIEIKSGIVNYEGIEHKIVQMVRDFGLNDRIIYSSFNHYSLKALKAVDQGAKIGLLYNSALYEPWRYAMYVGANAIHPYYPTLLAPGVVPGCHANSIGVHPWTVDDPTHIGMLLSLGVDIIITNKPDVACAVRASA